MSGGYALGIDGGGTKTEAIIVDASARVIGSGIAGSSNTSFIPHREAVDAYVSAISAALRDASLEAGDIERAGCTFASAAPEAFGKLGIAAAPRIYSELSVAFERAVMERVVGVAVIAGTGSHAAGRTADGRTHSVGGWGAVIGDDGSAYDIGIRAIRRALMGADGRLPPTLLTQAVCDYFGVGSVRGVVGRLCGTKVQLSLVAGFAAKVSEIANAGDEAAAGIIEIAGQELGEMAAFVASKLFGTDDEFAVVLAGGVFNAGELVVDPIRGTIGPLFPAARVVVARMRPGEAVARLALRER